MYFPAVGRCIQRATNSEVHVERWLVLDNMDLTPEIIAQKDEFGEVVVNDEI